VCKRGISSQLELAAFAGFAGALWRCHVEHAARWMPLCGVGCPEAPERPPSHPSLLSWLCSPQEDDESSQCSADFDLNLPDNGFMSKNEVIRSKVSRLTERLRKRYPSNNFGKAGSGCCLGELSRAGSVLLPVVATELGVDGGVVPAKAVLTPPVTSLLRGEDVPSCPGKGRDERVHSVVSKPLQQVWVFLCLSQSQAAKPCLTSALFLPGSCTGCAATFSVLKKRVSLQLLPQLAACTWGRGVCACLAHPGFLQQLGLLASVTAQQQMTSAKCWVLSDA